MKIMMKTRFSLHIIIIFSIISLLACEEYSRRRVQFQIDDIVVDRTIVAQGEPINLSATFIIVGATNEQKPSVMWESDFGTFEDPNIISTVWYAPDDYLGDVTLKLTATFMEYTDIAERAVRIVLTPATGWGSVSGNVLDESQNALSDVIVAAHTGEGDTTDIKGFFYIPYIPQGESGLNFSNVQYPWATELPQQITITGSSNQHLGNIVFYLSIPAEIEDFTSLPEHHALLSIEHENPEMVDSHKLYRANDLNGSGAELIRTIGSEITEVLVQEESDDGFFAITSVPANGIVSTYSTWKHVPFVNVIDPDAEGSIFDYNSFFTASLIWQSTGYENYYKGYRVAEDVGGDWEYVSPLLDANTLSYEVNTVPGQVGDYYVLAISNSDLINANQPEEQKIHLDAPNLEIPDNFRGSFLIGGTIRLLWEPLAIDNSWYSGYLIERKVVTGTGTIDWEELIRIGNINTGTYIDENTDTGNAYHYRISSFAYPDTPSSAYYSSADSVIVDLN
jgi:hypothetical protein